MEQATTIHTDRLLPTASDSNALLSPLYSAPTLREAFEKQMPGFSTFVKQRQKETLEKIVSPEYLKRLLPDSSEMALASLARK
ncbi:uncharacterized protein MONOS_17890 [Monocercomonoides exilis]|uniref:uncharacterized protein n=1 Tax=Monocercomonoides exilis TaxID=2049356 RepID=UPI00355A64C3|nr:hypothetical protein MONOS_17890 [Monocercomonoides exilis]